MGKKRVAVQSTALRGEGVMLGKVATRRSAPRIPTRRSAWITLNSPLTREHVALVRDISRKGVFFYSDFHPSVGDQLDFVVEFLNSYEGIRLHLKGAVVRVEQAVPGSAPGVAVSFDAQRGKKL